MPRLFIHTRNSVVRSRDRGDDYVIAQDALDVGIKRAVSVLADEVFRGAQSTAVEVSVEAENGRQVFRSVVTLSVSPLLIG